MDLNFFFENTAILVVRLGTLAILLNVAFVFHLVFGTIGILRVLAVSVDFRVAVAIADDYVMTVDQFSVSSHG